MEKKGESPIRDIFKMDVKGLHIVGFLIFLTFGKAMSQPIIDMNVAVNAILIHEDEINTTSYEFSPVFYGTFIGFVNDRGKSVYYDKAKNTPYFDLSFAGANIDGNLSKKAAFPPVITSENQEGPFCLYNNDQTLLLTRSSREHANLSIYKVERKNGEWIDAGRLELLGSDFHVCHPTVSASGNWLVFAAAPNQEGATMDLYIAEREGDLWVRTTKMPEHIQSSVNDWFPRFMGDSILIFASDRPGGKGGLDIYCIKRIRDNWTEPQAFPYPVNSAFDDFGLIAGNGVAYFSSNRPGGAGKDDLYRIEFGGDLFYNPANELFEVVVFVRDKLGLAPIQNARVDLLPFDLSRIGQSIQSLNIQLVDDRSSPEDIVLKLQPSSTLPDDTGFTNEQGMVPLHVKKLKDYIIQIKADKYVSFRSLYNIEEYGQKITLVLEPAEEVEWVEITPNPISELEEGNVIVFDHIYYDFNSHIIKEGAAVELDGLAQAMIDNPNLVVQLSAHTDSRGSRVYNQRLSDRRARSAKIYLEKKGIPGDRIVTIGFGESQLRNKCKDNVNCTEEEHRYNRRTEVKILRK